jgi:hypothetical protein
MSLPLQKQTPLSFTFSGMVKVPFKNAHAPEKFASKYPGVCDSSSMHIDTFNGFPPHDWVQDVSGFPLDRMYSHVYMGALSLQ